MAKFSTWYFIICTAGARLISGTSVTYEDSWDIATDPGSSQRLNGLSFQQDTLVTYGNHQYVAFYAPSSDDSGVRHVNVGRRRISPSVDDWQYLALTDYDQATDDEHNTISMGISSGDCRIHLSFDHHDVPLNYRVSNDGIACDVPSEWDEYLFGTVQHELPGSSGPWSPVTYPRFEALESGDLLFELRIGASGNGDSYIHRYSSSTANWSSVGHYLHGEDNNAYVNGIDSTDGRLYVSWIWRETPDPITNHDFCFAYSDDDGETWAVSDGTKVEKPLTPSTEGVKVYDIPEDSGTINQEAQHVDAKGRFHALMRDNTSGTSSYYHYMRTSNGDWSKNAVNPGDLSEPPALGRRGKIITDSSGDNLIALLPDDPKDQVRIYVSTSTEYFENWTNLATIEGSSAEPLVDKERLARFDVLSVFIRQAGDYPDRKTQLRDFGLSFD